MTAIIDSMKIVLKKINEIIMTSYGSHRKKPFLRKGFFHCYIVTNIALELVRTESDSSALLFKRYLRFGSTSDFGF